MEIIPRLPSKNKGSRPELELVENEKQEYKLLGRFLRTKGLLLFSYDSVHDRLYEVDIQTQNAIALVPDDDKLNLIPKDLNVEEATINSAHVHFEALNIRTARNRVAKFKAGKVKELCNLRAVNPDGIKFW